MQIPLHLFKPVFLLVCLSLSLCVRAVQWIGMKINVGLRTPLVESQQFCGMETEGDMVPFIKSLSWYILKTKREKEDEMIYETIRLLTSKYLVQLHVRHYYHYTLLYAPCSMMMER